VSITFFIPQAPVARVKDECPACDGTGRDDWENEPCPYCEGRGFDWSVREVAPFFDISLSNMNAHAVLSIIVPPQVPCDYNNGGTWSVEDIRRIYEQTLRVRNTQVRRVLETTTISEGNWAHMGRDEGYVIRRLDEFLRLLSLASEHGFTINYG
jgi:hypothetical protein